MLSLAQAITVRYLETDVFCKDGLIKLLSNVHCDKKGFAKIDNKHFTHLAPLLDYSFQSTDSRNRLSCQG